MSSDIQLQLRKMQQAITGKKTLSFLGGVSLRNMKSLGNGGVKWRGDGGVNGEGIVGWGRWDKVERGQWGKIERGRWGKSRSQ